MQTPKVSITGTDADLVDDLTGQVKQSELSPIRNYPHIIHVLQEMCGQGLVMRFGKASFENPEIGHHLAELLPGKGVTGMQKEHLMNFIWDLTSSSQAGRTELFENVNAQPVPLMAQRLYEDYDMVNVTTMASQLAGLS